MVTKIWVKTGSGTGLLPDSTKPLPEAILILWHSHKGHFPGNAPEISIVNIGFKNIDASKIFRWPMS